ncbi:MAG: U32 family peptidase [Coriobacteriia bacterium]|nr:U32 family peptidase [Coriobacteriia bacterium]
MASGATPEILAPAGTREAFLAAVGAGADAVYLGLSSFNARRGAKNFTLKSFTSCARIAHAAGARVYVTVNTVILPHEIDEVLTLVADVWNAGADAVIVQDIGLIAAIAERLPTVRIHVSTQTNCHDSHTLRALAELGVARVTLARELSLTEIATLAAVGRECSVEVEAFAHGALCVSYSGQCLMSSLVGRRSANRGLCAQPCRLPYELVDRAGESHEVVGGAHLLSPRDLCTVERLKELAATGIASLKIEGRMKSPGYVATVVANYKQAVVGTRARIPALNIAYNRGFTEAYLAAERGNEIMSYAKGAGREDTAALEAFAAQCIARAQALDTYGIKKREPITYEPPPRVKRKLKGGAPSVEIVAVCATCGAAKAALNAQATEAHVDAHELLDAEPYPGVVPVLPRVCHDDEFEEMLGVAYRFGAAVCATLGQLRVCRERDIPAQAHWSLNATNHLTCDVFARLDATRVWLSPELSGKQIAAIARRTATAVPLGMAISGMQEAMVTEHCVLMARGSCAQRCATCKRRTEHTALRDRLGYCFPVRTDPRGRSHLYNSVPLDLIEALPEIVQSGVSAVRLDLETARNSFVPTEVTRIRSALIEAYTSGEMPEARKNTTRGHFYRGVI